MWEEENIDIIMIALRVALEFFKHDKLTQSGCPLLLTHAVISSCKNQAEVEKEIGNSRVLSPK